MKTHTNTHIRNLSLCLKDISFCFRLLDIFWKKKYLWTGLWDTLYVTVPWPDLIRTVHRQPRWTRFSPKKSPVAVTLTAQYKPRFILCQLHYIPVWCLRPAANPVRRVRSHTALDQNLPAWLAGASPIDIWHYKNNTIAPVLQTRFPKYRQLSNQRERERVILNIIYHKLEHNISFIIKLMPYEYK